MIKTYTFQNYPDWAIPMAKIIPIFHLPIGHDIDTVYISPDFSFIWKQIKDSYELIIDISVFTLFNGNPVPIYLDMDIIIVNQREYFVTQTEGN